jgi:hypothetical protein
MQIVIVIQNKYDWICLRCVPATCSIIRRNDGRSIQRPAGEVVIETGELGLVGTKDDFGLLGVTVLLICVFPPIRIVQKLLIHPRIEMH